MMNAPKWIGVDLASWKDELFARTLRELREGQSRCHIFCDVSPQE